MGKDRM